MAKFSVIVPCYNLAPWIGACLDSVLSQSFLDWECVVVDDESRDESGAILDDYAARDARIRVIHQANKGEGGARNTGIAAAKGEWVFFLDGDDVMASGALQHLDRLITAYPDEQLIRFGYEQFQDGTGWASPCVGGRAECRDITRHIAMPDFYTFVSQHLYRRTVIQDIHFKKYKRGCDRVFVDDVLLNRVNSFVETSAVLYGYRIRSGSAMNSIPTVQVLKDEMWHRRDLVLMIEASKKSVDYSGSWWLERYFTDEFARLASVKPANDRKLLWREWYKCVKDMKDAKGLSARTRRIYQLSCLLPSRPVWWLLVRFLPWYRRRGLLPRIARRVRMCLNKVCHEKCFAFCKAKLTKF